VTAPLFAVVAVRIRVDSEGPVFFRQVTLGLEMREFSVLKFRTMRVDTDAEAHRACIERTMSAKAAPNANGIYKLDRSDAVTRVGRWLRKTILDKLPQPINVVRGEMSLVGPAVVKIGRRYPAVAITRTYDTLLADGDLDAVVIATPAATHHKLASAALRAGKHVFVEEASRVVRDGPMPGHTFV